MRATHKCIYVCICIEYWNIGIFISKKLMESTHFKYSLIYSIRIHWNIHLRAIDMLYRMIFGADGARTDLVYADHRTIERLWNPTIARLAERYGTGGKPPWSLLTGSTLTKLGNGAILTPLGNKCTRIIKSPISC